MVTMVTLINIRMGNSGGHSGFFLVPPTDSQEWINYLNYLK